MLSFEILCAQEGQLDKENFGISKLIKCGNTRPTLSTNVLAFRTNIVVAPKGGF